ncbi:MAG: TIGR03790 family protein, partial [Opitutales bacterium]
MKQFWLFLIVASLGFAAPTRADDAASVVVLVNSEDADSVAIGEYYAKQRGIPLDNIVRLETSTEETVSLREYVETISNPLLNELLDREWIKGVKSRKKDRYGRERLAAAAHRIRYLVTVRGVPLRFSNDPELVEQAQIPKQFQVNRASVDSELALLPAPPNLSMTAFQANPYFEGKPVSDSDANRIIKVSRLDGPTKEDVIRLIDRTLEAEASGLIGRAYIDAGGPHAKGDEWINATGDLAKEAYFDTEFETSKRPRGYQDRLDGPALYFGWYRRHAYGPWREARWSVPPGAIAYHLHSFSATTVRSASKGWVGPLVAQGYCATFGYVYEPYLEFTIRPQLFLQYLLDGQSFGDAVMSSNPALSWQAVAVGDPLYRPFRKDLDAQLATSTESPDAAYLVLRQFNRLEAEGPEDEALAYIRKQFVTQPSLAIAYRLARTYQDRDQPGEALEVLKVIRHINSFNRDDVALVQRIADLLHELGASELAFQVYEKLLDERGQPKGLRIPLLEGGAPVADAAGESSVSSRWSLESRQLKQPPESKK